jgi:hypothetical protein
MRAPRLTALVAGVLIAALGVLLLLEAHESVTLGFAYMAPVVLGTLGAILLASGLARRRRD